MESLAETASLANQKSGRGDPCPATPEPAPSGPPAEEEEGGDQEERRFLVSTFRDGKLHEQRLTRAQVNALDPCDVDFHWDRVFGTIRIRSENGDIRPHHGEIPGLGSETGIPLLEDVIWALGELLIESRLRASYRRAWSNSNARDGQVRRLRRAFGDNAVVQYFFIVKSRPWRIAWNTARSWRIIER
jgi:hypothetical protein